jgi:glycosyltransferase involved in cell wall biosynthesis
MHSQISPISAIVITFNEEANISRCLKSLDFADEIVVVDSFSADQTLVIAQAHDAKVMQQKFLGHVEQKNFATRQASHDWILSLDADEEISPELRKSILSARTEGLRADAYSVNRRSFYLTDWFMQGGWYPDRKIRLFNRTRACWTGRNPHDHVRIEPGARVVHLQGDLLHYPYHDLSDHLERIQSYSTIAARGKAGKRVTSLHLIGHPAAKFLKAYLLKGAILQGTRGLIFSVMAALSVFMKYAKLWELRNCASDGPERH